MGLLRPVAVPSVKCMKAMARTIPPYLVAKWNNVAQLWIPVHASITPLASLSTVPLMHKSTQKELMMHGFERENYVMRRRQLMNKLREMEFTDVTLISTGLQIMMGFDQFMKNELTCN